MERAYSFSTLLVGEAQENCPWVNGQTRLSNRSMRRLLLCVKSRLQFFTETLWNWIFKNARAPPAGHLEQPQTPRGRPASAPGLRRGDIPAACLSAVLCLGTSVVSDSSVVWPHGCSRPGFSVLGDSPGKNIGVGCHALLQGIFPTQESNLHLLHCRWILYHLIYQGRPWTGGICTKSWKMEQDWARRGQEGCMGKRESAPSLRIAVQAELARQAGGQTGRGAWGQWVLREGKQFPARGFMLLGTWLFPDPHQRLVKDSLLLTPPF